MQTARALLQRQMEEEGQRVTWVRGQVRRMPNPRRPALALVRRHGSCAHFGFCATHSGVVDRWSAAVRQLARRSTAEGQRRPLAPPALARPLMSLPCPAPQRVLREEEEEEEEREEEPDASPVSLEVRLKCLMYAAGANARQRAV